MVHLVDLRGGVRGLERKAGAGWPVLPLVDDFRNDWKIIEGQGDRLWFITDAGAPNGMVAELDIGPAGGSGLDPFRRTLAAADESRARWRVVVPPRDWVLAGGNVVGDRLILSYRHDGATTAVVTDLRGRPARAITLNGIGVATGFSGRPGDPETFYQFSSFNLPPTIYRSIFGPGRPAPLPARA
jgi:prolyl oligopeptidase